MSFCRKMQTFLSAGVVMVSTVTLGALVLGIAALWLVERELIARAGESLAFGAIEVADKLDATFQERNEAIEILAAVPQVRGSNSAAISAYLKIVERADDLHGRGVAMAKAVSFDQLDFQGCGNQVMVSVSLKGIDADAWPKEERKVA
jgi:hypothetical protein